MVTGAQVGLEQYLHTSFDNPDPEYWDGEIVERHMPTVLHSRVVSKLVVLLSPLEHTHNLITLPDLRQIIAPRLVLIPDVSVHRGLPPNRYSSKPPLVTIEVLSPEEFMPNLTRKFGHYLSFGVEHIWAIDPESRAFYVYDSEGLRQVRQFEIPEFGIVISPSDIVA